jgi:hypothetical protein
VDPLDTTTASILDEVARGQQLDPAALTLLLHQYCATGRDDLGDALGRALAESFVVAAGEPVIAVRAAWLMLFAEVHHVSDDERLRGAAFDLIAGFRREWPSSATVADALLSVDACLRAADVTDARDLVPAAIDELEHVVGLAYRPGEGVAHTLGRSTRVPGAPADQVRAASALLTAFETTGRLPYSMLAEELMQGLPRDWSDGSEVALVCDAARVLSRLAALHDDADYRGAAVVAADANYRRDAEALLAPLEPTTASDAAAYALAIMSLR